MSRPRAQSDSRTSDPCCCRGLRARLAAAGRRLSAPSGSGNRSSAREMPPSRHSAARTGRSGAASRCAFRQLGDQERQFDRLLGVEARIAIGVVAVVQIRLGDRARAAGALGDVLAGHLEMHAAGVGALGAADGEEAADLRAMRSNGRVL